jgi:hypothetical protein
MDHREMLRQAGEALYGERWQSELSRAVSVSDRTMRRWVSDPYEIPGGVWNDIQQLLLMLWTAPPPAHRCHGCGRC